MHLVYHHPPPTHFFPFPLSTLLSSPSTFFGRIIAPYIPTQTSRYFSAYGFPPSSPAPKQPHTIHVPHRGEHTFQQSLFLFFFLILTHHLAFCPQHPRASTKKPTSSTVFHRIMLGSVFLFISAFFFSIIYSNSSIVTIPRPSTRTNQPTHFKLPPKSVCITNYPHTCIYFDTKYTLLLLLVIVRRGTDVFFSWRIGVLLNQ